MSVSEPIFLNTRRQAPSDFCGTSPESTELRLHDGRNRALNVCRHGNLRQGSFGRAIAVASRIPPPEMVLEPLVLPVKHHSPMLSRHAALCIQSFTRCQARPPTLKPEGTGTQGCDWMDASLDLVHKRRTSATGQRFQADNGASSRLQEDDSRDITEQSTSMSASRHAACSSTHVLGHARAPCLCCVRSRMCCRRHL